LSVALPFALSLALSLFSEETTRSVDYFVGCSVGQFIAFSQDMTPLCRLLGRLHQRKDAALLVGLSLSLRR
jgi:hypothetical protein